MSASDLARCLPESEDAIVSIYFGWLAGFGIAEGRAI